MGSTRLSLDEVTLHSCPAATLRCTDHRDSGFKKPDVKIRQIEQKGTVSAAPSSCITHACPALAAAEKRPGSWATGDRSPNLKTIQEKRNPNTRTIQKATVLPPSFRARSHAAHRDRNWAAPLLLEGVRVSILALQALLPHQFFSSTASHSLQPTEPLLVIMKLQSEGRMYDSDCTT